MNKQEAIEKIEKILLLPADDVDPSYDLGYNNGLRRAKSIIEKIEPEKPVIPQFVAEWIEKNKKRFPSLYNVYRCIGFNNINVDNWISKNPDKFAHAWLDGYEVEKEKLYTAEFKLTGDFLLLDVEQGEYQFCDCSYGNFTNKFTEGHLKCLNVWDDQVFEIKEAE